MSDYPQPIKFEDIKVGMDVMRTIDRQDIQFTVRLVVARMTRSDASTYLESRGGGSMRHDDDIPGTWQLMAPFDPDAELVESLLRLWFAGEDFSIVSASDRESMREVLAVIREHDARADS